MVDTTPDDRADARLSILPLSVHRLLLLIIALALSGMDLSRLTGLWPCDIACQGGAHYQTMFGISVIWPALATHVLLAWLAWYDVRRGRANLWTIRLVHFLFGVSVFFLLTANALKLECLYCGWVHWLTFLAFALVLPFSTRRVSLWLPIAGWLITNALFHHRPIADVMPPPEKPPGGTTGPQVFNDPESDRSFYLNADRGRSYGDRTASRVLEVVVDLTCRHCAEQYRPLMTALKPAIAARRVRVVVRHLVRPSQSASLPAAELTLAAAAMGEHATAMDVLLGSNPDAGQAGLKARLLESVDPARLEQILKDEYGQITTLIVDDQQRITLLGLGPQTPAAVLLEDGKVTKRWSGNLPAAAIAAALDGAL